MVKTQAAVNDQLLSKPPACMDDCYDDAGWLQGTEGQDYAFDVWSGLKLISMSFRNGAISLGG
jgi:hypothetical protein